MPRWLWECDDLVFDSIRIKCAVGGGGEGERRFNAGSVNVEVLPGGSEGDGTAVEEGMGRWIMAPERLT